MKHVILCAVLAAACADSKEKPASHSVKASPSSGQPSEPAPGELPDDLKQLAEMPPLTAEATPEDIARRIDRTIDAVNNFFEIVAGSKSCDELGESLTRFAAVNNRVFADLREHSKNPEAAKQIANAMTANGGWLRKLGDMIPKCATHPKVAAALTELMKEH